VNFALRFLGACLFGLARAGEPIAFEQTENRLILKGLPETNPDKIAGVSVIKLECASAPRQVLGAGYVVL